MSEQKKKTWPYGWQQACSSAEKAKDFRGSMAKLFRYMERYKFRFVMVFVFAIAGTVFNIARPKILGKATTELYNRSGSQR